jgi:uncharacterized protein
MSEDIEIIHSPLQQTYSADGHTLSIQIYRSPDSAWILEVVDEQGTSTVWDDPFETDKAALEAAFLAIEEEGIASFVTEAQQAAKAAEPELLRKLEQSVLGGKYNMMIGPLSEAELDELDQFLLYLDEEESMTLDTLDGFLHAIAIGPETVMSSRWLPKVWGQVDGGMVLPGVEADQMERVLSLVMRHFNSIAFGFGQRPPFVEPLWGTTQHDRTTARRGKPKGQTGQDPLGHCRPTARGDERGRLPRLHAGVPVPALPVGQLRSGGQEGAG